MQSSIYIKGIDQLEREANKLIKHVNEGKTKLLLAQARIVRDRIRANAPVGPTGNLKRAAYATAIPASMRGSSVAFAGIRPRRAPHAHLVEFGHGGPHPAPAHPFIRPAWDGVKSEVRSNIEEGLRRLAQGGI